jgi:predicted metal-dependent phosphoesterase TrpH
MLVDLHCHSVYSDGELNVTQLIEKAEKNSLELFALTDHDCIDGVNKAIELAKTKQIKCIPGVEISINWKKKDIHIIGLNIDVDSKILAKKLAEQQRKRVTRAQKIASLLENYGVEQCLEKAQAHAQGSIITRPHFAKVLVDEAKVKDFGQAFKKYLARGKLAYVATDWMSIEEAIETIHQSGGSAVLAHPHRYDLSATKMKELITTFKELRGDGLEVVSGMTSKVQISQLNELCARYDLLASTGSDYHGPTLSKVDLGKQVLLPKSCKPIWEQWVN